MWTDSVNTSVYHQLKTLQLTVYLFLKGYKLLFFNQLPYGENELDFYYWKCTVVLVFKPVFLFWILKQTTSEILQYQSLMLKNFSCEWILQFLCCIYVHYV